MSLPARSGAGAASPRCSGSPSLCGGDRPRRSASNSAAAPPPPAPAAAQPLGPSFCGTPSTPTAPPSAGCTPTTTAEGPAAAAPPTASTTPFALDLALDVERAADHRLPDHHSNDQLPATTTKTNSTKSARCRLPVDSDPVAAPSRSPSVCDW